MAASGRWSLRNIYLYVLCLITIIMVIVATVNLVRGTVELAYPDPGYYGGPIEKVPGMSEAEFEKQQRVARESSRRQAILNLVGSAAMLLVAGPVYLYHWRKIESELPSQQETPPAA